MSVYLSQVQISYFKSFCGVTTIEIIKPGQWLSIIGKNGSGKSNFMEAIAFALGESRVSLRCSKITDLEYKDSNGHSDPFGQTYVAVTLKQNLETMKTFKRSIENKKFIFYIDDEDVSMDEYVDELKSHGLNIDSMNFLVYQGNIDSIIDSTPKERTAMFEEISRSIEFKQDYDKLRLEIDEMQLTSMQLTKEAKHLVQQKHSFGLSIERTRKRDQLVQKYDQMNIEYFLFILYDIEKYCTNVEKNIQENDNELTKLYDKKNGIENKLKNIQDNYKIESLKMAPYENKIKENSLKLQKLNIDVKKIQENIEMTQKILSKNQSKFNKAEADEKKRLRNIESLELQLADLSSIKNNFIKELSNKNIQLNDDDRKNYLQLRAKVSAKRDELNPNNQIDQRKKNYIERKLTYEKIQLDEINLILSHKLNMKETLKKNVLQLETVKRQTQENLTQVHEKLDGMKSKILSEDDVEGLKTQLEEIQMKLNDLNIASEYKKKQQKNQTIINILKKKIDGVHGRLHEFCQPIDKRYQTAMGKAFGNKYFGIIVDDSTTAATCIKFLKEHRMSPQLFIPMDNIKCTPLKEQLRSIKDLKDVHLLIDLLKYDVKYKNVVLNAAGSTLVCRNTDDARIVAFETTKMRNDETREYLDAVSLDGVFFRKNGSFSGKGSDFDMIKHIENSKEFNELTQKKRELLLKLLEHNNSTSSMAMSTIKEQEQLLLTYKNRSSYCEGNLAKIEKKLHELELSISELNEQKKNTQDNLKTLEQDLKNLDEEMTNEGENLDTQIAQYEKEIFTNFCKQKNIDNIKEFENFINLIEKKHEKLEDLNDQCSRIEELLKYERANKSIIEKISSYEDKLQELGDKITEMNDIRNSLQDEIKIISIEQSALENQLKEDKKKIALYSAKISELSLDLEQTTQKIIKLENEIDNYRHKKLEKLREKHDLLLKAKIQSIDLPMLKGNLDDLFSDDSSQDSWQNIQEREFQLKFDYSILPDNQLNEINSLNINLIKEKYQKDLSDIENEIGETTIPEAHDKLKNVDLKLKHLRTQKLQHAKKLNEKMRKFELIKWKRADKFNKFFKNVEESIGEIYKTLSGETAAQAVLMLYNPEEPYLDGIEYECCPSNKQRLPMSSFSGGERTIAGLSLLFSLRSALPPPFLIMDEIDGPLDKHHFNNLIKFFNTIKEKQQIILISLNDKIFSKSDVVIGVMKKICDFEDPKSQAFNINLEAYPQD